MNVFANIEKGIDYICIPLLSTTFTQNSINLFVGHSAAIGTSTGHRVECVGNRDYPSEFGNVFTFQICADIRCRPIVRDDEGPQVKLPQAA